MDMGGFLAPNFSRESRDLPLVSFTVKKVRMAPVIATPPQMYSTSARPYLSRMGACKKAKRGRRGNREKEKKEREEMMSKHNKEQTNNI